MTKRTSKARTPVQSTVSGAIGFAYDEIAGLRDEVQEVMDNMPENLQGGDLYSRREECVSALSNMADEGEPDVPEAVAELPCTYVENQLRRLSRADRRDNAVNALDAAISVLQEQVDAEGTSDDLRDELTELQQQLEQHKDEVEGADFPGMYG